jgi:hypothetical protein
LTISGSVISQQSSQLIANGKVVDFSQIATTASNVTYQLETVGLFQNVYVFYDHVSKTTNSADVNDWYEYTLNNSNQIVIDSNDIPTGEDVNINITVSGNREQKSRAITQDTINVTPLLI